LTGKRMDMSHRMHPIFTTRFAGLARTVLLKKDEGNNDQDITIDSEDPRFP
jgi:hypothetical protein